MSLTNNNMNPKPKKRGGNKAIFKVNLTVEMKAQDITNTIELLKKKLNKLYVRTIDVKLLEIHTIEKI